MINKHRLKLCEQSNGAECETVTRTDKKLASGSLVSGEILRYGHEEGLGDNACFAYAEQTNPKIHKKPQKN